MRQTVRALCVAMGSTNSLNFSMLKVKLSMLTMLALLTLVKSSLKIMIALRVTVIVLLAQVQVLVKHVLKALYWLKQDV